LHSLFVRKSGQSTDPPIGLADGVAVGLAVGLAVGAEDVGVATGAATGEPFGTPPSQKQLHDKLSIKAFKYVFSSIMFNK